MQKKIDDAAIMYNKTKDPKYKDLWYKLVKEYVNGTYNFERWSIPVDTCNDKNVRGNRINK